MHPNLSLGYRREMLGEVTKDASADARYAKRVHGAEGEMRP